jgi:hypothetical protein
MFAVTCEERATPRDSSTRSRPRGCAAFSPLRRCSSVTDLRWYAPFSRLGETKNRQQRGMVEYFNRLLRARASRRCGMIFAAVLRLDGDVDQFVMSLEQRSIGIAAFWLMRDD